MIGKGVVVLAELGPDEIGLGLDFGLVEYGLGALLDVAVNEGWVEAAVAEVGSGTVGGGLGTWHGRIVAGDRHGSGLFVGGRCESGRTAGCVLGAAGCSAGRGGRPAFSSCWPRERSS